MTDALGRAAGDQALVAAARLLESNVRPGDSVARLGEDEFAILLEHVTSVEDATRVAERILERLGESLEVSGHVIALAGSIGIALSGTGGIAFEDTLRGAEAAMERARAEGAGRYVVFDAVLDGPSLGPGLSAPAHSERRVG